MRHVRTVRDRWHVGSWTAMCRNAFEHVGQLALRWSGVVHRGVRRAITPAASAMEREGTAGAPARRRNVFEKAAAESSQRDEARSEAGAATLVSGPRASSAIAHLV